ncbi:MAG: ATP-dependent DNA helicase RecG [Thermoanaerobaculia bacterium]|nr:ATP-dependent DNA helicase RecG [Thermoanaerobaculia bacterium]
MTLDLRAPLREIKGIGPKRERRLAEEGVGDVGALLHHLPVRYEDRRRVTAIGEIDEEGAFTLRARLAGVRLVLRRGRRFSLVRGRAEDDSGSIPAVWFNRPYLPKQVEERCDYMLHGEVRRRAETLELRNASLEPAESALHAGRIAPVYPSLGPLGPALVRRLLTELVSEHDLGSLADPLPPELLRRRDLAPLGEALAQVHRPRSDESVEELNARRTAGHRRLIYGELFAFQLGLAVARRRAHGVDKGYRSPWSDRVERLLDEILPFRLTAAQRRVVGEIAADLARSQPMRRLLQGDVGSGKTAVALAALLTVLEGGLQAAFMVPTELLAEQHFGTLRELLGDRYGIALWTSSSADRRQRLERLASGGIDLVVGTHALLEEEVQFARLGLAVIDEQHRFGVAQRSRLGEKGGRCDLLVMTATPIPRSLTLTAYGDLDLSVIDELPPGRVPVETEVVPESERDAVYRRLAESLAAGGRGYVVFPMIQEQPEREVASLERGARRLARLLPEERTAVLHGGVPVEERSAIMHAFAHGAVRVLLATTVVEVGVDVPDANAMVIESAERFGLAQLHQLRGRVGRGEVASHCVAIHGRLTEAAERRLDAFSRLNDGFDIAEADLAIRGPGELLGTRQAGMPRFLVADAVDDAALLEAARGDARELAGSLSLQELEDSVAALGGVAPEAPARLRRS